MSYVARKITRPKWERSDDLRPNSIPADVTADLRTAGNSLSLWELGAPSNRELRLTALALAASAERIDRVDLAWVDSRRLRLEGISINRSEGRTPVASLRGNHVDAVKLDLERLFRVASSISQGLSDGQYHRFTRKEMTDILVEAVMEGLVAVEDLSPSVKAEIEKRLS